MGNLDISDNGGDAKVSSSLTVLSMLRRASIQERRCVGLVGGCRGGGVRTCVAVFARACVHGACVYVSVGALPFKGRDVRTCVAVFLRAHLCMGRACM